MSRFLTIVFVLVCVHFGWKHWTSAGTVANKGDASATEIAALASKTKAEDIVMYSTTECTYCAQAKSWLNQYGFAFTECNMSIDKSCEQQFKSYGANGTPYLVVRGQHMKDGFDSDEFLALISK